MVGDHMGIPSAVCFWPFLSNFFWGTASVVEVLRLADLLILPAFDGVSSFRVVDSHCFRMEDGSRNKRHITYGWPWESKACKKEKTFHIQGELSIKDSEIGINYVHLML